MSDERTTVVVLERGAEWPEHLLAPRTDSSDTVVIAQDEREHTLLLARRVESRIARLRAERRSIEAAVLAVSEPSLVAAPGHGVEGRGRVARALLRALDGRAGQPGILWISAPEVAADRVRHELFDLAGSLTSTLRRGQPTIALRFGSGAPPAGRRRSGWVERVHDVAV
jgi:hypothetical protein